MKKKKNKIVFTSEAVNNYFPQRQTFQTVYRDYVLYTFVYGVWNQYSMCFAILLACCTRDPT